MKQIAIIAGGDSSEYEISLLSAKSVANSLKEFDYEIVIVYIDKQKWQTEHGYTIDKNDFSYTDRYNVNNNFDYALLMIHGTPGENGILQSYFELIGVPYSGSGVETSALTFNKSLAKQIVAQIDGLKLAKQLTIQPHQHYFTKYIVKELGLPLFIKPNASGSSCGVSKIKDIKDIIAGLATAHKECHTALLEEFIDGIEVSQGIMIIGNKEYVLPLTELIPQSDFFDYKAKYTSGLTEEITPARLCTETTELISKISLEAYKILNCRGVVRFDYIIKNDTPYFIEVNTTPGMSPNSIVPQQWSHIGLTMGEAWKMIIENDLKKK